jgi:hypothetical protein
MFVQIYCTKYICTNVKWRSITDKNEYVALAHTEEVAPHTGKARRTLTTFI